MAGLDLQMARDMLDLYISAEKAVLAGQAYTIGTRSMRKADLPEIRAGRAEWEAKIQRLENGGGIRLQFPEPA